jgi:hypothetical protein
MKKQYFIVVVVILLTTLYFYNTFTSTCNDQNILKKINILENTILSFKNDLPIDVIDYVKNSINLAKDLCKDGKLGQARSVLWETSLIIPYSVEGLKPFLWIRNNLKGKGIISWWDYSKMIEKIGLATPIIKYPSRTLVEGKSIPELVKGEISSSEIPIEEETKVSDVAQFFVTSNEMESICIAKKYKAEYVFTDISDLNKYFWFEYQVYKGWVKSPVTLLSLQETYRRDNYLYLKYSSSVINITITFKGNEEIESVEMGMGNLSATLYATIYYLTDDSLRIGRTGNLPSSYLIFISKDRKTLALSHKENMLLKL